MRTLSTNALGVPSFDANGRLQFLSGASATRKAVEQHLNYWKNEWPFDATVGLDKSFLGQKGSEAAAKATITAEILATPTVKQLESLTLTVNEQTRQATVNFVAKSSEDSVNGTVTL